ncbi:hypothetical protein KF707_15995 [Candidatus Obscuribacterales bacterium]|jgi:hypothetical protein|nr:hypothetical protein [Candidatus Obscuribacterales bacterium]
MRKHNINFSFHDEELNAIAEKYGGWPRLLDPANAVPEAFILELEGAGYTEHSFQSIKAQIGKPEREYWMTLIASIVKNMQRSDVVEWHGQMLDQFLPKMLEHNITDEEIRSILDLGREDPPKPTRRDQL